MVTAMLEKRATAERPLTRSGDLTARLDALKSAHPEIAALVYLDFRAGTVLGTSSDAGKPQEALDALCRTAAVFLDGPFLGGDAALLATPLDLITVHRAPDEPGAALCLLFDPGLDPAVARAVAEATAEGW
jgi:hypothetical protein